MPNMRVKYTTFDRMSTLGELHPENVTMGRNVASGEMLLSDRRESLSEEQHDEPEKQARVVGSCTAKVLESEQTGKAEDVG